MRLRPLLGRFLLALLFILSGATKLTSLGEPDGGAAVAFMKPKLDNALHNFLALVHVPYSPPTDKLVYVGLLAAAAFLEVGGGIAFTLDLSLGAWMLALFLVPTTVIMHDFWSFQQHTAQHQIEFINFMKNVCILGGLIIYLSIPKGSAAASKLKLS